MPDNDISGKLTLTAIGYIRNSKNVKFDAPHQPDRSKKEECYIELLPKLNFEQALIDLEGFEYIWLIWWFHKNNNWKPMVLPPRGKQKRRGVFATRSPYRPNPLGMTAVKLLGIQGRKIKIGSNDLVDGTPIFDIKPYLTDADCFPDAKQGWLAEIIDERGRWQISYAAEAKKQLSWLSDQTINFIDRACELLIKDPSPHRTRRIIKCSGQKNIFRMSCGAWRLYFSLHDNTIRIQNIEPGYPMRSLKSKSDKPIPFKKEQLEFLKIWPES